MHSMTLLDESINPGAQYNPGTGMPSSTGASSSTNKPSVSATTNKPLTGDKSSTTDTPTVTDEMFTTITPLIDGITLDDDKQPPTQTSFPKWHRPAHAVLSTNELLCNIIAHLPLEDIVAATGICKSWRNAMAADLAVQQALFLKPVELSEVLVETRQLLALGESETIDIDRCTVVGQLNPFAEKMCGSIKFRAAQSHKLALPRYDWRGCFQERLTVSGDLHPKGIWRDMFITQPPCIRVHVKIYELRTQDIDGFYVYSGMQTVVDEVNEELNLVECSDGVKLGDLYDYIHTYHRSCAELSVRTTVRKYVTECTKLPDRTSCIFRNGQVRLPEQLSDLPDVDCDAFGGDFDYHSTWGSWKFMDMEEHWPESYYERYDDARDDDQSYSGDGGEQESDGELDDEDEHDKDVHEGEVWKYNDDENGRRIPRVNVYLPLRRDTAAI